MLVEFRKRSEVGRRRQKDFCLCCEPSIGCFTGLTLFKFGLHLSCSYSFIAPGKRSDVGCCCVKMRQKSNTGDFRI